MKHVAALVLRRSVHDDQTEPYMLEVVAGLEEVLLPADTQVLVHVVDDVDEECVAYRRWAAGDRVDSVVLTNIVPADPRPDLVVELGMPAVILGEPDEQYPITTIRTDGYGAMVDAVRRLDALGHRRIAHVSGPADLLHTRARQWAFADETGSGRHIATTIVSDYSAAGGARATRTLLSGAQPPTAIIYDNDVMAIAGLAEAAELGVAVPGRLSVVAWDDSVLCRTATPPLSAVAHDVHGLGVLAGGALLDAVAGKAPRDTVVPQAIFIARGTTGRAPELVAPQQH